MAEMKLMIASDIHGSEYYCRQMLEAFDREQADRLLILGDILYHGPRNDLPLEYAPKEVIPMLNERKDKLMCVRGNCDTEVDQMVLDFPILADYAILPITGEDGNIHIIYATHGHNYNPDHPPVLSQGDVLLNGHTHIPGCSQEAGFIYMNPGSVAIPKEESEHSYMILKGNHFQWKNMDGNSYKEYYL